MVGAILYAASDVNSFARPLAGRRAGILILRRPVARSTTAADAADMGIEAHGVKWGCVR